MNNEQKEVIEHLVYQLELSVMNNLESYEHTEYVNGIEVVSEISREKHLELIMKWCAQELKNNFQLERRIKMNWEIKDLMCDIEVIKQKINDVATKHAWFVEDRFVKNELETKREHINFSASYLEHRIQNEHTVELLQVYLKEFDELIQKFHEIEKASSDVSLATESDDAKNSIKVAE